jgi:hypothetical protein
VLHHALEQVTHLDIGLAVLGIRDLRTLAEQGVGLVEKEDGVGTFGPVEDGLEFLSVSLMYSLTMVASSILNALRPAPLAMVSGAIVYPDLGLIDKSVHAVAEANPVGVATAGEDRSAWLT